MKNLKEELRVPEFDVNRTQGVCWVLRSDAADNLQMKFLTFFVRNLVEKSNIPLNLMSTRTP